MFEKNLAIDHIYLLLFYLPSSSPINAVNSVAIVESIIVGSAPDDVLATIFAIPSDDVTLVFITSNAIAVLDTTIVA